MTSYAHYLEALRSAVLYVLSHRATVVKKGLLDVATCFMLSLSLFHSHYTSISRAFVTSTSHLVLSVVSGFVLILVENVECTCFALSEILQLQLET